MRYNRAMRYRTDRPPRVRRLPVADRLPDAIPDEVEVPPFASPAGDSEPARRVVPEGPASSADLPAGTLRRSRRKRRTRLAKTAPQVIPRNANAHVYISTRWFSAFIVLSLLIVLYLFLSRDVFFISTIYVGGTRYLSGGEIFERTGLADPLRRTHIFWVNPAAIEATLEEDPSIADAEVRLGWPPMMVQVSITERDPSLIWEQAGVRVWVDSRGNVMSQRQDLPNLPRVIVEKPSNTIRPGKCPLQGVNDVLGRGSCIEIETVAGVIQFKALYPSVNELVYDPVKGLGYRDGRGWLFWFGDGRDLVTKIAVYNEIVRQVFERGGRQFTEVNVTDPDAPYYRLAR